MRPSWTASAALAISISFRTAASGSLNGLGSANFTGFVLGGDVRDVDQRILEAVAIKHLAAVTAHHRAGLLRRQPLAGCPHGIFPRGPISLIAPRLEVSLGSFRQKHQAGALKIGACLVKGGGGAILMFARMRAWIKAASPLPRILVVWAAAADRDRASLHIPIVDVPAFLGGVSRSAASEFGHAPSKRGTIGRATASGYCRAQAEFPTPQAARGCVVTSKARARGRR